MTDTVRNAVFGNVGTIICFRVSADDSPILAKQFEPQFEANDLLQMHNRNFVINMVINGEKTPAFSAKTLNLPAPQTDNTGRIIEHTRNLYSRSREEVELEISNLVNPNKTAQTAAPVPTPETTQWPINAHTNVITPDAPPSSGEVLPADPLVVSEPTPTAPAPQPSGTVAPTESAPQPTGEEGEAPKKKRRRRKRKKTGDTAEGATLPPVVATAEPTPPPQAPAPAPAPQRPQAEPKPLPTNDGHETEIRLR